MSSGNRCKVEDISYSRCHFFEIKERTERKLSKYLSNTISNSEDVETDDEKKLPDSSNNVNSWPPSICSLS